MRQTRIIMKKNKYLHNDVFEKLWTKRSNIWTNYIWINHKTWQKILFTSYDNESRRILFVLYLLFCFFTVKWFIPLFFFKNCHFVWIYCQRTMKYYSKFNSSRFSTHQWPRHIKKTPTTAKMKSNKRKIMILNLNFDIEIESNLS